MSTHNIYFYGELTKIILLICSSDSVQIMWTERARALREGEV